MYTYEIYKTGKASVALVVNKYTVKINAWGWTLDNKANMLPLD